MSAALLRQARRVVIGVMRRMAILRARSYRAVFMPGGVIDRDHEVVLADLRDFGCAAKTTFHADPTEAARRQGRREMWLRISQHLNLDEAKVQKLMEIDDGLGD
ncbi:MAG TPA: hypothetical protein VGW34_10015 [Allosphingosinicella sp.]|nr:hypothetical protein [Allosphingosinicella sp.]